MTSEAEKNKRVEESKKAQEPQAQTPQLKTEENKSDLPSTTIDVKANDECVPEKTEKKSKKEKKEKKDKKHKKHRRSSSSKHAKLESDSSRQTETHLLYQRLLEERLKEIEGGKRRRKHSSSKTMRHSQHDRFLKDEKEKRASDVEQARQKAAKIREQGLQKYKEQLLVELEHDKFKKLCVVAVLYLAALSIIGMMYYSNTELDLEKIMEQLMKPVHAD